MEQRLLTIGAQLLVRAEKPAEQKASAADMTIIEDSANAGIRREPELPEHEDIAPERAKGTPEFVFEEEESDDDAVRARMLRSRATGLARQAAMDPGDGIEL